MSHQTARDATRLVQRLQAEDVSQTEINRQLRAFLAAADRQQKETRQ